MTCETLSKGRSLLHRTDPRVKLLSAALFSMAVVALDSPAAQVTALAASALVALAWLRPRGLLFRRLSRVNIFIALLWLVLPWSTPGSPLFHMGPMVLSREGLELTTAITMKCNAIVLFNMAMLSTSTIFSLAHAMAHLKVPSLLVQLFFFSWRYLHVIEEEMSTMKRAALLRGFEPRPSGRTYRTYAHMLGSLLVRSYDRGNRVYNAMVLRGFDGTFWLLSHFTLGPRDQLVFISTFFLVIVLGLIQWHTNYP